MVVAPIPAAPTNLTATLQAGPQVALAWVDKATNELGYTIQRSDNGGAWATIALLAANATAFTDTTVTPGNTYDYQVSTFNLTGASAWAGPARVVVPSIPAAPSAVGATQQPGLQIAVTWTDNANNETGFTIQRSVNGTAFVTIAVLGPNMVGFIDLVVTPGDTYAYQVSAFNLSGSSAWATSGTVAVPTIPAAPSGLARTITRTAAGPDSVAIRWTDNATNETGFTLQRATNSAFTTGLVTFSRGANVATFTNTVPHGATYYYRVQAYNLSGASAWSNTITVTTVPATPTNFRSTGRTRTSITLAWNDVSSNETGYRIQRHRVGLTTWTTVVTTAANVTSYRNTGRTPGTAYQYRIRGVNGVGNSPWSPIITVSTLP